MPRIISHDSETPAQGQQVITASAFIFKIDAGVVRLFSPRRAATKKFLPGVIELPGGHLEFGESLEAGLKREIEEEFQIPITIGDCFYAFTYLNQIKGSHSVEVIFFAQFSAPETQIQLNPEDHSEFHWYTLSEYQAAERGIRANDDPEYLAVLAGFSKLS